ncbi:MAG: hypothetical protein ACO3CD_05900 [Candidatus Nanopelagicaceae bacterium]
MLLPLGIKQRKDIVDKVSKVKEWIKNITVKREELGGFSICPYAFSALVHIEERALSGVTLIEGFDVVIFIVEDDISVASMLQRVSELNMIYKDYIWLDDHKEETTYINGVQSNFGEANLILCQKRDKLLQARETLHKTNYYTYWSNDLYKRIVRGIGTP